MFKIWKEEQADNYGRVFTNTAWTVAFPEDRVCLSVSCGGSFPLVPGKFLVVITDRKTSEQLLCEFLTRVQIRELLHVDDF
jgi:hypothetical protein